MKSADVAVGAGRTVARLVLAALAVVTLLQIELVWNRPVNWDEFFHLSEAHAFTRGDLHELLQVFYARSFFWLAWLKLDAVDQIRLARVFMLACEMVTCCAIFAIARRFANETAALLATLAYISAGYVLQHGMSFRADPMAAATLMAALWILLCSRLHIANVITASFLIALGFAITIKIVLYAPAFLAVAWVRWHETADRRDLLRKAAILIFFSIAFAALFTLASWFTLPSAPPPAAREASKSLSSSGTMMFDLGLFPRWPYLLMAMFTAPVLTLAALRAAAVLAGSATAPGRNLRIAAWLMLATIGCVSFYANSFPYFYAFILPPVAVVAAIGMEALAKSVSVKFLVAAMLVQAMASSVSTPRSVLPTQKQMLAAVHQIFPQPVAYFDFPGMVPEFSKANFFMTVWGVRKYRAGLEPSLAEAARMQVVPLLIVNQEPLERNQTTLDGAWELKPKDRALLKDGFIPHWGPLWVAGHAFRPGTDQTSFIIYAPGTYTLEGGAARIDGAVVGAGQTVQLARGNHLFVRLQDSSVVLRWGDHLARPSMPEPVGPVLKDF